MPWVHSRTLNLALIGEGMVGLPRIQYLVTITTFRRFFAHLQGSGDSIYRSSCSLARKSIPQVHPLKPNLVLMGEGVVTESPKIKNWLNLRYFGGFSPRKMNSLLLSSPSVFSPSRVLKPKLDHFAGFRRLGNAYDF